jgi:hypothetical protein
VKHLILVFGIVLYGLSLGAQEVPRFTFDVAGGFTMPVASAGRSLDQGWNIRGAGGVNFSQWVGAVIQVDYNRLDINGATLSSLGFPGGNVHVFSATLNPIVHLVPRGPVDIYVIGGGGMYRRTQEFTQPALAVVTGFNPFFGFFDAVVPTTQVLASSSIVKPGVNGGAGIAFGSKWKGKFFAEARYHRMFMNQDQHTDYIPVSFGYRW